MSKLHEISYCIKSEYQFEDKTFEYECKIWFTRDYEANDFAFSSIIVYNENGDIIPEYELSKDEIENIKCDAVMKSLEKLQPKI